MGMAKRKSADLAALSETSSCGCPNTWERATSRVNLKPVQAALHNRLHIALGERFAIELGATAMSISQIDTFSIPELKGVMQCEF
jgi:hypothetical protein